MLSIRTNMRVVVKTQARLVKNASENIRFAMVEIRNDTIDFIKEEIDNPDQWQYGLEHMAGMVGREGGSQVRDTPTSEFFAFIKQTQPSGKNPFFNFTIQNGSPEGIGEFLLSGTSPHGQQTTDHSMVWQHTGMDRQAAHTISHPGAVSRFDDIIRIGNRCHRTMFDSYHQWLIEQGDGIFGTFTRGLGATSKKQVNPRTD